MLHYPQCLTTDDSIAAQRYHPTNTRGKAHKVGRAVVRLLLCLPFTCRPSSLDVQFVDYDGVRFHLCTPEKKTILLLSMHIRCWSELVQYGALDVLKREYGSLVKDEAEPEYNVSLEIDLEQAPTGAGTVFLACILASLGQRAHI